MNQIFTIIIISIAVVIFLIRNHFKRQVIEFKMFIPPMILAAIFAGFIVQYPDLKSDAAGFVLRFLLGLAIGVLQGCLTRIDRADGKIVSAGTKVGLAFWLVFIPVRLFILPWFSMIAPSVHNLEEPSLLGISAISIFTGFFISKGITLLIRKVKLVTF